MSEQDVVKNCSLLNTESRLLKSTCLLPFLILLGACSATPQIEYRTQLPPVHLLVGPANWVDPPLLVTEDLAEAYINLKAAHKECVADFNALANWAKRGK